MAVFTSFSDESTGKTRRDTFMFAGWMGTEEDWTRFFTPVWHERVLAGPPRIPYLHMTEFRSHQWRGKHGLAKRDTEKRIDEACDILYQLQNLQPILVDMDAGDFRDEFSEINVHSTTGKQLAVSKFEPDYICFLFYAMAALRYLEDNHPEAEKLDFVVERNNKITNYIQKFHSQLPDALVALGSPKLARLVGELLPARNDRLPLQAADLLCWHCARNEKKETTSPGDRRRYLQMVYKRGVRITVSKEMIVQMKSAVSP